MGFQVDLVRHRDHGHVAAGHGDELTVEEQTELSISAQGTEINEEPGHPFIVRG
jgi:hypothetical protein